MRFKATLMAILLATATIPAHAVNYDQPDKRLHTGVSFALASMFYGTFRLQKKSKAKAMIYAIGLTMAIGHMKESTDPFYDKHDMDANAVGAFTAPILWAVF